MAKRTPEELAIEQAIRDLQNMLDGYADSIAGYEMHEAPIKGLDKVSPCFKGWRYRIGDWYIVIGSKQR